MSATWKTILPIVTLAALIGCQGKELNILGYSTAPPFDSEITSVYIPTFKTTALLTNPNRGIEVELTEAVVRELGKRRSPMRVVSDPGRADTELVGTITTITKGVVNRNQQNYTREAEVVITAEVVWRDLRSGRVLTNPRTSEPTKPPENPFDPSLPQPPPPKPVEKPSPVQVVGAGRMLPELGESNVTAEQMAINDIARRIVNMMEKPW